MDDLQRRLIIAADLGEWRALPEQALLAVEDVRRRGHDWSYVEWLAGAWSLTVCVDGDIDAVLHDLSSLGTCSAERLPSGANGCAQSITCRTVPVLVAALHPADTVPLPAARRGRLPAGVVLTEEDRRGVEADLAAVRAVLPEIDPATRDAFTGDLAGRVAAAAAEAGLAEVAVLPQAARRKDFYDEVPLLIVGRGSVDEILRLLSALRTMPGLASIAQLRAWGAPDDASLHVLVVFHAMRAEPPTPQAIRRSRQP